jgi:hypothetical protein
MRRPVATVPESVVTHPTFFEVGQHRLAVAKVREGRWTVAVDDRPVDATFESQADAWQAGVREALRIDTPSAP